ncbi:hypothetical protein BZA77DRAFT_312948 [Pyronema omphalodes]|nr:hypothetical protein BZA77DRAFT_312948 [Pyronema omphalodes]
MKVSSILIILPIITSTTASAIPVTDTKQALEERQTCAPKWKYCHDRKCCPGLRCEATGGNPRVPYFMCLDRV